eukprot:TRINITY_DN8683_c0_g1_i1.p1 TRINITY_DN8683_c0_g1~~TRINITY_DN8683_c0_g1_i1.p1  ORF type:complete len:198 (+),score=64.84 TRINITY_DN8683_c0_g1_i1:51-644(+)
MAKQRWSNVLPSPGGVSSRCAGTIAERTGTQLRRASYSGVGARDGRYAKHRLGYAASEPKRPPPPPPPDHNVQPLRIRPGPALEVEAGVLAPAAVAALRQQRAAVMRSEALLAGTSGARPRLLTSPPPPSPPPPPRRSAHRLLPNAEQPPADASYVDRAVAAAFRSELSQLRAAVRSAELRAALSSPSALDGVRSDL